MTRANVLKQGLAALNERLTLGALSRSSNVPSAAKANISLDPCLRRDEREVG